jgi:hypothetical protein
MITEVVLQLTKENIIGLKLTSSPTFAGIKLTSGASLGYVLTSAADGTASWSASSTPGAHALDGVAHTIGSLTTAYLVKSDGSKLVPATNTDTDVASAVSLKHAAVSLATDHGLSLSTQQLAMGTPSTLTAATTNAVTTTTHTHAVTGFSETSHNHNLSGLTSHNHSDLDNIGANDHHNAVTVSAPIALSTQAISLVNNAVSPATVTAIDIDGTLAGNSDTLLATQKAVKTYADTKSPLAGSSSIVTVGTVGTGSWHATTIDVDHGGTGATTLTDHGILLGSGTGAITPTAVGATGEYLAGSTGADPVWATLNQAAVAGLTTASSPVFVTVKLSALTDGRVPYHIADATGLADSSIRVDSTGRVSLNDVVSSAVVLRIRGDVTTGAYQYATSYDATLSGTTQSNVLFAGGTLKDGVTAAAWAGLRIDNAILGSGASITTQYGIFVATPTRGSTNYAIFVEGGETCLSGDLTVGGATTEAGSTKTVNIKNGTAPDAHVDNQIIIYSVDSSDSTSTLGLFLEQAVEDIGTFTASNKIKIKVNGTEYWMQLDAV